MTLNKLLRGGILLGVFFIPFIPLIVTPTLFFPFITGKNFTFRIIVEVIFALWLILALRDSAYRPKRSAILTALVIFLGIIGIADMAGVDPRSSVWSNFERMEGYITLLHLFAYFLVAGTVLATDRLWKWFFHTSLSVSAIIGAYGLFQLAGKVAIHQGGVRLDATFGNATYLAIYMLFHVFLAAFYLTRHRGAGWVRGVYGALILFQLFTLYHTATRGVTLGLIVAALVSIVLIVLRAREEKRVRTYAFWILALIVFVTGTFFAFKDVSFVRENEVLGRFASLSLSEGSSRFLVWNMAWEGFKERPFLGWGQNNFGAVFDKHYDPGMYSQEPWFDRTHNIVFDWLIAGGALGLFAYVGAIIAFFLVLWKKTGDSFTIAEKCLLSGLVAGYVFQLIFVFDNITSYIIFFSLLAFVHAHAAVPLGGRMWDRVAGKKEVIERFISPLIIIALAGVVYWANIRGISAARTLIRAISPQEGGAARNLALFRQAIAMETMGTTEAREQLLQFTLQASHVDGVDEALRGEAIAATEEEMKKQIAETPYTARPVFFFGTFYRRLGRNADALEYLDKAQELSPQKQQIAVERALIHIAQDNFDISAAILEPLYTKEPRSNEVRYVLAVTEIYRGNETRLRELMAPEIARYGAPIALDDAFVHAYFVTGRHENIVRIWEVRVADSPTNVQYNLSLAAAYLNAGDRGRSIAAIEHVIELEPGFAERGNQLIAEIRAGRTPQ